MKQSWNRFQAIPTGRRFITSYNKQHKTGGVQPKAVLQIGVGLLLMIAGGVMLVIPGPGIPVLIGGAVLIARHVKPAARALDWLDVRIRRLLKAMKREWKQSSPACRGCMIAGVAAGALAVGYALVKTLFLR